MFHQLLESNAVRKAPVAGSLVSTVAHAALVAAAIAMTVQRDPAPPAIPDRILQYTPVIRPPEAPSNTVHGGRANALAPASNDVLPTTPALPRVLDIVIGIPSPDLTRPVTDANDFAARRGPGGNSNDGIGTGAGPVEGGTWLADQVDKPVILMPGSATPSYPALLRSAGVGGGVLVEFVVDTLGRVESGSQRIMQADHDLFAASVRDVMPRLRFMPAEARGRKVRQLVRLPFRFDVNP
jgi:TonB family protein